MLSACDVTCLHSGLLHAEDLVNDMELCLCMSVWQGTTALGGVIIRRPFSIQPSVRSFRCSHCVCFANVLSAH